MVVLNFRRSTYKIDIESSRNLEESIRQKFIETQAPQSIIRHETLIQVHRIASQNGSN